MKSVTTARRAKALEFAQVDMLLATASSISGVPESAELRVLLSFYAGLRASEIANLRVSAMIGPTGEPAASISIHRSIGKGQRARDVPMHPRIRDSLVRFRMRFPHAHYVSLSRRSHRKPPAKMSANAVTIWFHRLYRIAGLTGCSSHSGRRTFATVLAKQCNAFDRSLRDVQEALGHTHLSSTQAYVQPAENIVDLVCSLGGDAWSGTVAEFRQKRFRNRAAWEGLA